MDSVHSFVGKVEFGQFLHNLNSQEALHLLSLLHGNVLIPLGARLGESPLFLGRGPVLWTRFSHAFLFLWPFLHLLPEGVIGACLAEGVIGAVLPEWVIGLVPTEGLAAVLMTVTVAPLDGGHSDRPGQVLGVVAGDGKDDTLLSGDVLLSISPNPALPAAVLMMVTVSLYIWMEATAITPVKSLAWLLVMARTIHFLVVMFSFLSLPPQLFLQQS